MEADDAVFAHIFKKFWCNVSSHFRQTPTEHTLKTHYIEYDEAMTSFHFTSRRSSQDCSLLRWDSSLRTISKET